MASETFEAAVDILTAGIADVGADHPLARSARVALLDAHATAVAEAEARGRHEARLEVDKAGERLAERANIDDGVLQVSWSVDYDCPIWHVKGDPGKHWPASLSRAILAAARALAPDATPESEAQS